jgi:hypothetical protein
LVPQGTIQLITLKNQNYDEIKSLIPSKNFKIISIPKNLGSKDTVFDNSIDSNKLEDIEIITIANLDKE